MGSGLGAAALVLWVRDETGSFEKVSHGGRVLVDISAMVAEREALRMGIERLVYCCQQMLACLFLSSKIQVEHVSTNLTRSLCGSSVNTEECE